MTDQHNWQEYAAARGAGQQVEAYICRKVWCTELDISSLSLLEDVATLKAPTSEWYALHYVAKGDDKWNHDVTAWGLNITKSDLSLIRNAVAHFFTAQHTTTSCGSNLSIPDVANIGPQGIAYVFDEAIEMFDSLYSTMKPRLSSVRVPRFWRESAISAFARSCITPARRGVTLTHRARIGSCPPTTIHKSFHKDTAAPVSLSFDCVDRIFSVSGLKLGTMRALARVWGFNSAEIETLTKRRCNPITLLGKLVADPETLRDIMHDCDVVLVGSRAMGFFWPSASLVDSDWKFITHPHVSHWLKFAAYLVSIGVEFDLPESIDDCRTMDTTNSSGLEQEHHSAVKVLHGTLWHKGRRQRLQLAAHPEHPRQQSSIQKVLQLHSSVDQCFVTGFGAICMYAQETTNGQSHVWSVGDCHDSGPRVEAQRQVDRNMDIGIEYTELKSHARLEPSRIPEPKLRRLGDAGTLTISFEQYVSHDKAKIVRTDFNLLREITWWEECHGLEAVRQAGGSFWSLSLEDKWAERVISRGTQSTRVPLFDSIMERLRCTDCQMNTGTLCWKHGFPDDERFSARLLFFCLYHVERRRMSWSFLGLDVHWDECWEYPYV